MGDNKYSALLSGISQIINEARGVTVRAVNSVMTATYWEIGRMIVENEQKGKMRAEYGKEVISNLSIDLTKAFGKGFSRQNLERFRLFYQLWSHEQICSTLSSKSVSKKCSTVSSILQGSKKSLSRSGKMRKLQTSSAEFTLADLATCFPLPWSCYVTLLSVKNDGAREFYETEALRNGWSVRELKRQISSSFYERVLMSKKKAELLKKEEKVMGKGFMLPEEAIKDPFVLEFLDLKDEYSESDLEESLIQHLEKFLLELGDDFAFMARQKKLRIGEEWYKIDLLFFHRRLRCLVIIDLKIGKFTHADAGQMHVYLNYAKKHWTHEGENPPVGLILCAQNDDALAKYALDGLKNKVLTAEYKTVLPDEKTIVNELKKTQRMLESGDSEK